MREIKVLHLEPTDVCQAECPLCARETDAEFDKSIKHHLTLSQIQKVFSDDQIQNLDKMYTCGVYGDPAAGRHTVDFYKYFRELNPTIALGMNTNGAIQSSSWWQELGTILNQQQDFCVFSIDGLEDTNHIYRKNVNWNKLMENVTAFISAGGRAHWDMLVYKHNQHQVDTCEQLAKDIGFKWFRAKVSRRGFTDTLEAPVNWRLPSYTRGTINCLALKEQGLYIDTQGRVSPCCFLGARQSNFITDIEEVMPTWNTPLVDSTCASICSTTEFQTVFKDQWQREIEFC